MIGRRDVLKLGIGAAAWLAASRNSRSAAASAASPFAHGVASGDPTSSGIVLWTRVNAAGPTALMWAVATDAAMTDVVASGETVAAPGDDFTVHVEASGLQAGTEYRYVFWTAGGEVSPVGRTRTLPAEGSVDPVRFAAMCCSSHAAGYFNAYAAISREDIDFVLHLGDFIYESGNASVRTPDPPHECVTLPDYRRRYAQYVADPDLRDARAAHPWICVWDDHEFANDAWSGGAAGHQASEGSWSDRMAAATKAWREWTPTRWRSGPAWNSRRLGGAADLIVLDTRRHRSHPRTPARTFDPSSNDRSRTMLGAEQKAFLTSSLLASSAAGRPWRIVANQTIFSPHRTNVTDPPLPYLPEEVVEAGIVRQGGGNAGDDNWGAFWRERDEIIGFLREHDVRDTIVVSGDAHAAWGLEIVEDVYNPAAYDPVTSRGSVGVEVVCTSVTSHNLGESAPWLAPAANAAIEAGNPNVRYCDLAGHGYCLVELRPLVARVEWVQTGPVTSRTDARRVVAGGQVDRGRNALRVDRVAPVSRFAAGPATRGRTASTPSTSRWPWRRSSAAR